MVRQWSPPYNRPKILRALKRYGQRGGGVISVRRRRVGGTIFGPRGEFNPLTRGLPDYYIRRLAKRRKSRRTR